MMFDGIKAQYLATEELTRLVETAQEITKEGYAQYDQNFKLLESTLKKVLKLSKQEKEWYVYFITLYELLYLYQRDGDDAKIVKYAEVYYKNSALYMDKEIPNYSERMGYLNIWIYDMIFGAYYEYYQIDDAKMDVFMKKYEETVFKYGKIHFYYMNRMLLGILYRDVAMAEEAARNFLIYEKNINHCYVCAHMPYLTYLLFVEQNQKAEELMLDLIHKNIPKKHLWCYKYCEVAEPDTMYIRVMKACVWNGKVESFQYFYENYWKKLPKETQREPDCGEFQSLLGVFDRYYDNLETDLEQLAEDIDDENKDTTVGNIYTFLGWWCYFWLLDQGGVHSVKAPFLKLEVDAEGLVSTQCISGLMLEKADEYAAKFTQARARFDYEAVKDSYQKCFLNQNRTMDK